MAILRVKDGNEWLEIEAIKGDTGETGPQGPQGEKGDKGDKGDAGASEWGDIGGTLSNQTDLQSALDDKQDELVSGTNIKTINNQSLLGSGNINVSGGGSVPTDVRINGTSITSNDVADIKTNGTYNATSNKIATMSDLPTVPTKVSDLTNDSGFITNTANNLTNYYTKTNTYTKTEVDQLIGAISTLDIQIVQTLPATGSTSTIYLVPKTASTNDNYDEYIYVSNSWEHIGSTEVDLSNYYTKTQTDNLLDDKADTSDIPTKVSDLNNDTGFITSSSLPTKVSDLTNDAGYITGYTETDPVFTASAAHGITSTDITNWNNKSTFSGNYNDLTNKPTIPDELKDLSDDSTHRLVTDTEKTTWNNKSNFSGSYNDLTNKPSIPNKTSDLTNDSGFITGYTETDPIYSASAASSIVSSDITNWNNKADEGIQEITQSGTVNIWQLEEGVYRVPANKQLIYKSGNSFGEGKTAILVVNKGNTSTYYAFICGNNSKVGYCTSDGSNGYVYNVVDSSKIKNVLTETSSGSVLDARQGKVLKDYIGTLSSLTTTDKTDLVSAINEVKGPEFDIDDILAITSTSDDLYVQLLDLISLKKPFYISDDQVGQTTTYKVISSRYFIDYAGEVISFVYNDGYDFYEVSLTTRSGGGGTVIAGKYTYSTTDANINGTTVSNIITNTAYDSTTNKIATMSDIETVTGDLANLETTDTTDLVAAINEVNAKDIISVGLTANTNVSSNATWTHYTVPIDDVKATIGNKLTFNSSTHRVIVGDGVSYVKVSVYTLLRGIASGIEFNVRKNGSGVVSLNVQPRTTAIFENAAAYLIVPVSSGDYFDFTIRTGATGTITIAGGSSTAITFEAMN